MNWKRDPLNFVKRFYFCKMHLRSFFMSFVYCRKILFLVQILILLQKILLHITKKKKNPLAKRRDVNFKQPSSNLTFHSLF